MMHTSGGGRVDAVALLAGRVLRTRERTVATLVAVAVVRVEVEHDDRQLSLALLPPPRASVPPLPALSAPLAPDAEALTRAAVEAVARAERSVLPTVRPGRHVVEVVGATEAA